METAIVKVTTPFNLGDIWKRFPTGHPPSLNTPSGGRLVSPVDDTHIGLETDWKGDTYRYVEVVRVDWARPTQRSVKMSETIELTATQVIGTRTWRERTQQEIDDAADQAAIEDANEWMASGPGLVAFEQYKNSDPSATRAKFQTRVRAIWPRET